MSVVTQDIVSVKSDAESVNTETQLALRVEKETKPMMHLVKLLKEMDPGAENNSDSKNNAIASLIDEFEEEVVNIEQQIMNPMLTNGEDEGNDELQQIMEELPPDWIALIDEDSGDVYYSNEVCASDANAVACDVSILPYQLTSFTNAIPDYWRNNMVRSFNVWSRVIELTRVNRLTS